MHTELISEMMLMQVYAQCWCRSMAIHECLHVPAYIKGPQHVLPSIKSFSFMTLNGHEKQPMKALC